MKKVGKNRGIKNPYRQSILLSQSYKSTSDPGCRKIVLKQDQMTLVKQDDGLITLRVAKEAVSKSVSRKLRRCLEATIQKRPVSMPLPRPSRLRLRRYPPVSRVRQRCPLSNPTAQTVLNETGIMGQHDVPCKPVFVCNGFAGEVSPIADTDALVDSLCAKGAHITEAIAGVPDAFTFLIDRSNGVSATQSYSTTAVFDVLNSKAIVILRKVLVDVLTANLELHIGPASNANIK